MSPVCNRASRFGQNDGTASRACAICVLQLSTRTHRAHLPLSLLTNGAPRRKRCAPAFNSQYIRPLSPGERHLGPCFSIITRRKKMFGAVGWRRRSTSVPGISASYNVTCTHWLVTRGGDQIFFGLLSLSWPLADVAPAHDIWVLGVFFGHVGGRGYARRES